MNEASSQAQPVLQPTEEQEKRRQADANRLRFPAMIAIADGLRRDFGAGVDLKYISENGQQAGKPGAPGVPLQVYKSAEQILGKGRARG